MKIAVALRVGVATVQIHAVVIHLPDFHEGIADGITASIEDAPAQVCYFPDGWSNSVVNNDQIIVRIERQVIRIERPFGLARGAHQLFGEGARDREERSSEAQAAEKTATILKNGG